MAPPSSDPLDPAHARLRFFFDGAPVGVLLVAENGEILDANRRALALLAATHEQVVGVAFATIVEDGGVTHRHLREPQVGEFAFEGVPATLRRTDGRVVPIDLALRRVPDGSSVVSLREPNEISVRSWADHLLQSVLEHVPAVVYLKDREGRMLRVNREYERIFGFSPGAALGHTEHELFPKDVADGWRKNDLAIMEARTPTQFEETAPQTDGLHTYVSVKFPLLDGGGNVLGVGGISTDISERKRSEEALTRAAQELERVSRRFQAVVEVSPVPYALNDDQGRITYLNPAFVRTFGYDLRDIPTLADWWPRAYPDEEYRAWVARTWAERLERARRSGTPFEPMEITIRAKDGTDRIVTASAASLGDVSDTHLVLLYDVTRDRRLAAERRALEERLADAQRLESIGRLAGGVAHDSNNVLMVILAHAEAALSGAGAGTELRRDLDGIITAAEHLAELVRQLLAHARRQPIAPRVVDVADTIQRSASLLERLIGENITLTVRTAQGLWPVRVDPGQLEQVVANLTVNARDAIGDRGVIGISVENVTLAAGTSARYGGATPGDYVALAVTDDGTGMTPEVLAHLFEPFFTTKSVGKGTGLGLATVYGIVKQNGGFVAVESEPGRGSTISVLLPRHAGPVSDHAPRPPGPSPSRPAATVLLVEDETPLLAILTRQLRESGYHVLPASGASEALRIATDHPGPIDVLVTDVIMPEMNGRQLADLVLELHPTAACLFASGYTADVIARQGVLEPNVNFLEKPFTVVALDEELRRLLGERRGT